MYFKSSLFGIITFILILTSPFNAVGQTVSIENDAVNKINIAGRQRMLSQRIAKSLCFATIGISVDAHMKAAKSARELFAASAKALRKGSPEMGLLPEQNPRILDALRDMSETWMLYDAVIGPAIEAGKPTIEDLRKVQELNLNVLKMAQATVTEIENVYGNTSMEPSLAKTINMAGRQRMLSQKSSKEFCFIRAGIDIEANKSALRSTALLFDDSIFALAFGDENLQIPAPSIEIEWQNIDILSVWYVLNDILRVALDDGDLSEDQLQTAADINNIVLKESNRAVSMYTSEKLAVDHKSNVAKTGA